MVSKGHELHRDTDKQTTLRGKKEARVVEEGISE